jgi:hypothetical protein
MSVISFDSTAEAPNGPALFLYDLTSSYLEREHNALAAWGYNRDGKKGRKQIVIGLVCDARGCHLSIKVFADNTTTIPMRQIGTIIRPF